LSRQCEARDRSAKMHSRASHICTIAVDWELSLASHTRLFGPGNSDQSRPNSSHARRTMRASRIWRGPPSGTSAFRPSR
jgi:hypothetical protein